MRPFRDNRNIYRIWRRYEDRGILRFPLFLLSSAHYLLRERRHAWDYAKELDENGCITALDGSRYPGIRLYLPDYRTDLIQRLTVRSLEFFEDDELSRLRERYIKDGAVICDCGAYIGSHTVFFGKACRAGHIYAFEPVPRSFHILQENIRLNGLENAVTAFRAALGHAEGQADIMIKDAHNAGAARVVASDTGKTRVMKLDDAVPEDVKVDLVKIDVEGSEYDLLRGAGRILGTSRPVLFMEIFEENKERVFGLLREYGYSMREDFGNDNYLFAASEKEL